MSSNMSVGKPMANYAASRRIGDWVLMSGIVAFDPIKQHAIRDYRELPAEARDQLRPLGFDTGQMSVDVFEAPVVAQSWFVLDKIRQLAQQHGGEMKDVVKLVQYFTRLPDYALFNRVRGLFYPEQPPVSTVIEVARFLPGDEVLIEIEATMYCPQQTLN